MAKFTEIKVGDLVSYQGYIARVMGITNGTIRLSRFGTMYFDEAKIQMVESVNIPKFKNNDRVFVRDIPDEEKVNMVVSGIGEWISMLEKL